MDYISTLTTLITFASSLRPEVRGLCVFPSYTQSSPKHAWVMPHSDDEKFQAHFSGNTMIGTSRSFQNSVSYERTCEERIDDDKYLVAHREHNKPIKYICMQFVKRSESVIQLRMSNFSMFMRPYICHDQNLMLDHRPLVSIKHYFHHKVHCPFQGGYNFHVYNPNGDSICNDGILPLRVESECENGEGMAFRFREDDCIERHWDLEKRFQKTYCLAQWKEGPITFVVLRKVDRFHVWCMRITKERNGRRTAYIFFDFVCDPGEYITMTNNYIRLEMEKKMFSSTCEDESSKCSPDFAVCESHLIGPHCPLQCKKCSYNNDLDTCRFLESLRGEWLQLSETGKRKITIRESEMKIQGIGNFRCIRLPAQEFLQREVLLQIFDNGCHPRYTCVDLDKTAPSVIRYRLGHSVEWPLFHLDHKKQHICGNHRFLGVGHEHKPHMKTSSVPFLSLVNRNHLRFVKCDLPPNLPEIIGFVDAEWCGGCLSHNRYFSSHAFSVSYANCSRQAPLLEYQCLASMQLKEYRGIVTKTKGQKEYLCWIFLGNDRIYNVLGSDCDYITAENVHLGFEEPAAEWMIRPNASFCGLDGPSDLIPDVGVMRTTKKSGSGQVHGEPIPESTERKGNGAFPGMQSSDTCCQTSAVSLTLLSIIMSTIAQALPGKL